MKTVHRTVVMAALGIASCSSPVPTNPPPPLPFGTASSMVDAGQPCIGRCSGTSVAPPTGLTDVPFTGLIDRPRTDLDAGARGDAAANDAGSTSGRTYDYVITRYVMDEAAEPGVTRPFFGFNVDGRFSPLVFRDRTSADCFYGDHFSSLDPDQNAGTCMTGVAGGGPDCQGGVDNQLPMLEYTFQQFIPAPSTTARWNNDVGGGQRLMMLRVSGVDGSLGPDLNDPEVQVRLYPYAYPGFASCGSIQSGNQTYYVDDRSLTRPGDLNSARLSYSGAIIAGRLRVSAPVGSMSPLRLPLQLVVFGEIVATDLHQPQLRGTLSDSNLSGGNLGGVVVPSDLLNMFLTAHPGFVYRDLLASLARDFVDVPTTGDAGLSCADSGGVIGVGLGFSGLRATIATTTVSRAPMGTCGASLSGDAGVRFDVQDVLEPVDVFIPAVPLDTGVPPDRGLVPDVRL